MNRMKDRFKDRAENPTQDPRLDGMETKYGGRTVVLEVILNTERSMQEIAEVIRRTVRGPKLDQIVIAGYELDGEESRAFWSKTYEETENHVKKTGLP